VLCCAVLCCAVLCCAVLCCAVLCCAVLCCAVQAVCQLSRPPPRWVSCWQDVMVSRLKGLTCREALAAAELLLLHDITPSKPWAGLWCVAMEVRRGGGRGGGVLGTGQKRMITWDGFCSTDRASLL